MTKLSLLFLVMFAAIDVSAIENTPENRNREADRYFTQLPVLIFFSDLMAKASEKVPAEKKAIVKDAQATFLESLKRNDAAGMIKKKMMKEFTADELHALADLASSESGRAALRKLSIFTSSFMPLVQAEAIKALNGNRSSK